MNVALSILDLASLGDGEDPADCLEGCVALARRAEETGYRRVWYAEHHNISRILSSAPAVLIAHVAAHTERIRLGSGGVMLPNHAPLTIAEQFGTLATLHPGRIDLGLGRAPGTDQATMVALRRDALSAETFPADVRELQGYLSGATTVPGVEAVPGRGTDVPIYLLGSSLYSARLAAALGLPFAFASHFAPAALEDAVSLYRRHFVPSEQLDQPYVIAAANVIAADADEDAGLQLLSLRRRWARMLFGGGRRLSDDEADAVLASPRGRLVAQNLRWTAAGTPEVVREFLEGFAAHTECDELILAHNTPSVEQRLRSVELTAEAMGLTAGADEPHGAR